MCLERDWGFGWLDGRRVPRLVRIRLCGLWMEMDAGMTSLWTSGTNGKSLVSRARWDGGPVCVVKTCCLVDLIFGWGIGPFPVS